MPLIPQQVAASIRAAATFPGGLTWIPLTEAIGAGVVLWATSNPVNLALTGVTTGTLGAGVASGSITVPANVGAVTGAFTSAGIVGPTSGLLATAIAVGVSTSFTASATYTGPSVGVSSGTDLSRISVANPATLIASLSSTFGSTFSSLGGFAGAPTQTQLATAIGNGIALLLQGGVTTPGTGIVAPTAPAPGAGTGTSPLSIVL